MHYPKSHNLTDTGLKVRSVLILPTSLYLLIHYPLVHYHDSGSIISHMYPKSLYKARSEIELTCSFVDIF